MILLSFVHREENSVMIEKKMSKTNVKKKKISKTRNTFYF